MACRGSVGTNHAPRGSMKIISGLYTIDGLGVPPKVTPRAISVVPETQGLLATSARSIAANVSSTYLWNHVAAVLRGRLQGFMSCQHRAPSTHVSCT